MASHTLERLMRARILNMKVERGDAGLLYATCEQIPKLLIAAETLDELQDEFPRVLEEMFRVEGYEMRVFAAEPEDDHKHPWVAIPTEVAKQSLETDGAR